MNRVFNYQSCVLKLLSISTFHEPNDHCEGHHWYNYDEGG